MLTVKQIEYLVHRYQLMRQTIGPEMVAQAGRSEGSRLRSEWLKELELEA